MKKTALPVFLIGFVLGCGVIAAAIFFVGSAEAQKMLGPYMLMHHGNATAAPGVFRLNQSTGYISYCYIDAGGKAVICTAETP